MHFSKYINKANGRCKIDLIRDLEKEQKVIKQLSIAQQNSTEQMRNLKKKERNFPGGAVVKDLPANAGNTGLSPGPGKSHRPRSS